MDTPSGRALTSQLADDLAWLERHCRTQPDQARAAGQLRMAASLVRNVIGPYLDGQPPAPLHVAVVGGAGSGKSTVANFLIGATAAEANPQAGFTRHPVVYVASDERYNDEVPTQFLQLLLQAGKPVVVVLTKMKEADAPALIEHFKT